MSDEVEAVAVEAVAEARPMRVDPKEYRASLVDTVRSAKTIHVGIKDKIKRLRMELADALIAEVGALEELESARGVLKKEAEGE